MVLVGVVPPSGHPGAQHPGGQGRGGGHHHCGRARRSAGLPAHRDTGPGGVVPARPALGVKIGNYPGDRPSAGLDQADIVFEEPVEGAITRLLAVFQCQGSPGR